jgi:hypothetical protein
MQIHDQIRGYGGTLSNYVDIIHHIITFNYYLVRRIGNLCSKFWSNPHHIGNFIPFVEAFLCSMFDNPPS